MPQLAGRRSSRAQSSRGVRAHGRAALGSEAADETKTRSDRHGVVRCAVDG